MKLQRLILVSFLLAMPASGALAERSAADQALYQRAVAACNGPKYPSGARPYINYAGGWFRCVEPRNH
jgi:hypothetical protein